MIRGTDPCNSINIFPNETNQPPKASKTPIPTGCYRISKGKIRAISKEEFKNNVHQSLLKTNQSFLKSTHDNRYSQLKDVESEIFPDFTWDTISDSSEDFSDLFLLNHSPELPSDLAFPPTSPQKSQSFQIEIPTSEKPSPIETKLSLSFQLRKRKLKEKESTDHKPAKTYCDRINALDRRSLENQFPLILPKETFFPLESRFNVSIPLKLQGNSLLPKPQINESMGYKTEY